MSLARRLLATAIVARSNIKPFERPDRLPRSLIAMAPWGTTLGGIVAGAAGRYPDRCAVEDESGEVSYAQLWSAAQHVAASLVADDIGPGVRVGLMCRNHAGFVEWLVGVSITGADVVLLNVGFAAPQLADVVQNE